MSCKGYILGRIEHGQNELQHHNLPTHGQDLNSGIVLDRVSVKQLHMSSECWFGKTRWIVNLSTCLHFAAKKCQSYWTAFEITVQSRRSTALSAVDFCVGNDPDWHPRTRSKAPFLRRKCSACQANRSTVPESCLSESCRSSNNTVSELYFGQVIR